GRGYRITVEVGAALLELREVFDRLERALRAEEALDVHAAQARRVDPAAMRLRPDVTDEVGGGRRVAVDVTVEAGDALHAGRLVGLAVGGGVELLLGGLRHQETHALDVLGVEDALEYLLEVVGRHKLSLRDVAQVRPGGEKDGRRELGQELLRQVVVEVEAFHAREELDLHLREEHPASLVLGMRERQEALREEALLADLLRRHRGQRVPFDPVGQPRRRTDLEGLAPRHRQLGVGAPSAAVALLEELLLASHDGWLVGLVLRHHRREGVLADQHSLHLILARLTALRWHLPGPLRRLGLRARRWRATDQDRRDDNPSQKTEARQQRRSTSCVRHEPSRRDQNDRSPSSTGSNRASPALAVAMGTAYPPPPATIRYSSPRPRATSRQ